MPKEAKELILSLVKNLSERKRRKVNMRHRVFFAMFGPNGTKCRGCGCPIRKGERIVHVSHKHNYHEGCI